MDQVIKNQKQNRLNNNAGFLSADFLFSIVIGITVSMMLFALCFTFSTIEISQYVAFSVSRAHMAGHDDPDKQTLMANNKYEYLTKKTMIGLLFRPNSWFELRKPDIRSGLDNRTFGADYEYKDDRVPQTGVRLDFVAKILNFNVAFLGKSSEDDKPFTARVTGLLFREPSSKECREQMKNINRYSAILNLDRRFGVLDSSRGNNPAYFPLEDNGC
ncbi:MAG: hypothetical protein AABY64_01845 [Bdellovibrionota bacterium]